MCGPSLSKQQQEIVLSHISLAYQVASKYARHQKYEDVKQACLLGLCEAALTWTGDSPFETYARVCIRHKARQELSLIPEVSLLYEPVTQEAISIIEDVCETLNKLIESELTLNEQLVVRLKYPLQDSMRAYNEKQIACLLEKSASWVSKVHKQAIEKLGRKLSMEDNEWIE